MTAKNDNTQSLTPRQGQTITSLMRRINALDTANTITASRSNTTGYVEVRSHDGTLLHYNNTPSNGQELAIGGGYIYAIYIDSGTYKIERTTVDLVASEDFVNLGSGPYGFHIDYQGGNIYVYQTSARRVEWYSATSGSLLGSVVLAGTTPATGNTEAISVDPSRGLVALNDVGFGSGAVLFSLSSGAVIHSYFVPSLLSQGLALLDGYIYMVQSNSASVAPKVYKYDTASPYTQVSTYDVSPANTDRYVSIDSGPNGLLYALDSTSRVIEAIDPSGMTLDSSRAALVGANVVAAGSRSSDSGEFYKYTTSHTKESLGTPDGGVSIPALGALDEDALTCANYITDMRTAIEALAPYYENADTSNAFNFTDASADNLYFKAMGDRSAHGATGGPKYTWTRTLEGMENTASYDIDIGEIEETVTLLENSDLV